MAAAQPCWPAQQIASWSWAPSEPHRASHTARGAAVSAADPAVRAGGSRFLQQRPQPKFCVFIQCTGDSDRNGTWWPWLPKCPGWHTAACPCRALEVHFALPCTKMLKLVHGFVQAAPLIRYLRVNQTASASLWLAPCFLSGLGKPVYSLASSNSETPSRP